MAREHLPVQLACRVLHVAESGYYAWRDRPSSNRLVKHAWLTEAIVGIHTASRGTYGSRRVHAELGLGLRIHVSHGTVELLMQRAGLHGLPGNRRPRAKHVTSSVADLVERNFTRHARDQLWVTDTEHPTWEGTVYCAVVLDTFSRRVVGWSIDASPTAALTTNALAVAIGNRSPRPGGTIIHSDPGVEFGSWAFTQRARASGLRPSMGSIGDCVDNAMVESFWARVQVELLKRRRWRTRLELSTALFEYLEIFHNRQRRHSALGMLSPVEYELRTPPAARNQSTRLHPTRDSPEPPSDPERFTVTEHRTRRRPFSRQALSRNRQQVRGHVRPRTINAKLRPPQDPYRGLRNGHSPCRCEGVRISSPP
jgi:transposase InsO family protein